jgi:hypothetical protein
MNWTALSLQMTGYSVPTLVGFAIGIGIAWPLRREAGHPSWWNALVFLVLVFLYPFILGPPLRTDGSLQHHTGPAILIAIAVGLVSGLTLRQQQKVALPPKATPHVPLPIAPKPPVLEWYFQGADGEAYGPVAAKEMAQLERAGAVQSETLVLRTDGAEWVNWESEKAKSPETAVNIAAEGRLVGSNDVLARRSLRLDPALRGAVAPADERQAEMGQKDPMIVVYLIIIALIGVAWAADLF